VKQIYFSKQKNIIKIKLCCVYILFLKFHYILTFYLIKISLNIGKLLILLILKFSLIITILKGEKNENSLTFYFINLNDIYFWGQWSLW
jgi:hypothetical protein